MDMVGEVRYEKERKEEEVGAGVEENEMQNVFRVCCL